jgi:hypothetical protein
MIQDREDVEALGLRLPQMPPAIMALETVQDLARAGATGQSDGVGFVEIGGS